MISLSRKHRQKSCAGTRTPVLVVILIACAAYAFLAGTAAAEPRMPDATAGLGSISPAATTAAASRAAEPALWLDTYARVSRLADQGSVPASRLALEMHRHGAAIYGINFAASATQVQCWQRVVECGRCEPCVVQG